MNSGRRCEGITNFGLWTADFELDRARDGWLGLDVDRDEEREAFRLAAGLDVDAEAEARDLPPSILDHVGGVDLVCLGGAFLAAEDCGMGVPMDYCVLLTAYWLKPNK